MTSSQWDDYRVLKAMLERTPWWRFRLRRRLRRHIRTIFTGNVQLREVRYAEGTHLLKVFSDAEREEFSR